MKHADDDQLLHASSITLQRQYLAAYPEAEQVRIRADVAARVRGETQTQPSALKRVARLVYGVSAKEDR